MLFLSSETDFLIFMKDPLYVIVNVSIHGKIYTVGWRRFRGYGNH